MSNTFDTYQAEIEYRSNKIRKDIGGAVAPPRPDPVRTPGRGGHPHQSLTASRARSMSIDTASETNGAGPDN